MVAAKILAPALEVSFKNHESQKDVYAACIENLGFTLNRAAQAAYHKAVEAEQTREMLSSAMWRSVGQNSSAPATSD